MLILNTLATKGDTQVKQGAYFENNPSIVKIFDDLESFKNFCREAFAYGHDGYVFNERDLYNNKSRAWQAFCAFRRGKKRPKGYFRRKH